MDEISIEQPVTFPKLQHLGLGLTYGVYTAFAVLSFFFVLRFVKESNGRELEDMTGYSQETVRRSVRRHGRDARLDEIVRPFRSMLAHHISDADTLKRNESRCRIPSTNFTIPGDAVLQYI